MPKKPMKKHMAKKHMMKKKMKKSDVNPVSTAPVMRPRFASANRGCIRDRSAPAPRVDTPAIRAV